MENRIIRELVHYPNLVTVSDYFGESLRPTHSMVLPNQFFGIEIEMENYGGIKDSSTKYMWNYVEDGSLRESGREAVSLPSKAKYIPYMLEKLRDTLECIPKFSGRTSVHVHMNIRDMRWDHLVGLVALYCIFERPFYDFAGPKRWHNIFCVPLIESTAITNIDQFRMDDIPENCMKYSGLNLLPIVSKGTIEFRQMQGNLDIPYITTWINLISCLRKYVEQFKYEELMEQLFSLSSSSAYGQLAKDVFGEYCSELFPNRIHIKELDNAVKFIKGFIYLGKHTQELSRMEYIEPNTLYAERCNKINAMAVSKPKRKSSFLNYLDPVGEEFTQPFPHSDEDEIEP